MAAKKGGKNAAYYDRQKAVTAGHKTKRAARVAKKLAYWIAKGTKKNGKPVKSLAQRKELKEARTYNRVARKAQAKPVWTRRKFDNRGNRNTFNRNRPHRAKPAEGEAES